MQLKPTSTFWKVIAGVLASIAGFLIVKNKRTEKKLVKAKATTVKAEVREINEAHEELVKGMSDDQLGSTVDARFGPRPDSKN